ncbi:hypothetical protein GCM10027046_02390 [Uliginosibacterium flavum]|uniref:FAD-binding oxidoreductase n=1 Tax=Uliginosibacterium flavum TaxID=1396831 RepID=A0ABV2THQ2_9RHOO
MPEFWMAVLLALSCAGAHADEIAPFSSDGCSEFPDGTLSQKTLWRDCCVAHDLSYWAGGSYAERLAADREMERCVGAVGEPAIATLMLAGVRVGGSPFWPTRFRWGYGWPLGRGYKALTEAEREQVRLKRESLPRTGA